MTLGKIMKYFCPVCNCERECRIVRKNETYPVKGESVTIEANVCTCSACGEEIMTEDYDDDNLKKAFSVYRERHGLLQPDEIKAIRESYGVSQVTFARVLGVGDKTVARYENGSLQDEAINNLILLSKDPKNFVQLLDKNSHLISEEETRRIYKLCGNVKVFTMWTPVPDRYKYTINAEDMTEYA